MQQQEVSAGTNQAEQINYRLQGKCSSGRGSAAESVFILYHRDDDGVGQGWRGEQRTKMERYAKKLK